MFCVSGVRKNSLTVFISSKKINILRCTCMLLLSFPKIEHVIAFDMVSMKL